MREQADGGGTRTRTDSTAFHRRRDAGFLDNVPQWQSRIQVAYSSRDADEGAMQAHALKGAAANASAQQLHAVAKSLESAFRAVNWERVERHLKDLPEAIRATEEAMRAHQKRSQS